MPWQRIRKPATSSALIGKGGYNMQQFDINRAAKLMAAQLQEAQRRIQRGEPFGTTAADIGCTPAELRELFEAGGYDV